MAQNRAFSLGGIGSPCCCGGSGGSVTIAFIGCASLPVPGLFVGVYTSSAKTTLVFSGTTDSLGQVYGTVPSNGTYWIDATGNAGGVWSRFASLAAGSYYLAAGGGATISLGAVASGHACSTGCFAPLASTLYWTDSYGTWTLTYNATTSLWQGNTTTLISYAGCNGCRGCTCTGAIFPCIVYQWNAAGQAQITTGGQYNAGRTCAGPCETGFISCGSGGSNLTYGATWTTVCPTAASNTFESTAGGSYTYGPCTPLGVYCGTPNWVVTE